MKQFPTLTEPTATVTVETVVRKSRFITTASPVATVAAAESEIRRARDAHPTAGHVVYAFILGDHRSEQAGMSDAGEPKGTAGRPVMEILRGSGVRDLIITVVRYFGGTKLGTGGLVHAYGNAAREVLDKLPTRARVVRVRCEVTVPYDLVERIRQYVTESDGAILGEEYATDVRFRFEIPESGRGEVENRIRDLSNGSVALEIVD